MRQKERKVVAAEKAADEKRRRDDEVRAKRLHNLVMAHKVPWKWGPEKVDCASQFGAASDTHASIQSDMHDSMSLVSAYSDEKRKNADRGQLSHYRQRVNERSISDEMVKAEKTAAIAAGAVHYIEDPRDHFPSRILYKGPEVDVITDHLGRRVFTAYRPHRANPSATKMRLPRCLKGKLIGTGGMHLKKIKSETNCSVTVVFDHVYLNEQGEEELLVTFDSFSRDEKTRRIQEFRAVEMAEEVIERPLRMHDEEYC